MKLTKNVNVQVGDESVPVALEIESEAGRWTAPKHLPESEFPLIAEVDDRRLELYSDGTFAEVEKK